MKKSENSHLPSPWRVTFDTNPDLCNLHCIMCDTHSRFNPSPPNMKSQRLMKFNLVFSIIEELANKGLSEVIPSTMGEPLLYPYFPQLVSILKEKRLKLNLTTNGTFPKLGVERWAKQIFPVASDVKISINSWNKSIAQEIMQGIDFNKHIDNIKKFIEIRDKMYAKSKAKPSITLQCTFMEKNINELPKLVEKAIELGVDRVKGHHVWITWPQIERQSLLRNEKSIDRWNQQVKRLKEKITAYNSTTNRRIELDNFFEISVNPKNNQVPEDWECPFLGREAWIAWDGTFNVCCAPDHLRKSLGDFGNVTDSSFLELWQSDSYEQLCKNWKTYEVCQKCRMRKPINNKHM